MHTRVISRALLPLITALILAACGQQAAAIPTPLPTTTAPAATQAAPAPTAPAATQAAPATPAPAASAPTAPAAPTDDLAGVPHGRTAEGYQALGAEGAPVTLVMYSDFF